MESRLNDPKEVNLYDLNKYVILPATIELKCSMVELMTTRAEQAPDFFVSHCDSACVKRYLY